jgi:hypothetical protein
MGAYVYEGKLLQCHVWTRSGDEPASLAALARRRLKSVPHPPSPRYITEITPHIPVPSPRTRSAEA